MKKAQKRGDIPKNMNIFALMWSMKNKGDKPHYKPGVKDVLKKKYKGPEGQNEEKAGEKPYPPTRLFKNVPNSVVKKANKEADKVKREQEKAVLGEPPKNGPSGASMHSKDNVYEDEKVDMVSQVAQALQMKEFGLPPATVGDKDLGDKINKAHDKEQKRRAAIDAKKKAKTPAHPDAALTKQRRGEEVEEGIVDKAVGVAVKVAKKHGGLSNKDIRTGAKQMKTDPGGALDQVGAPKNRLTKALAQRVAKSKTVQKALKKHTAQEEGWGAVSKAADELTAKSKAREDKARNKKVSAWAKGRREGVEIDELSKATLGRYVKKAASRQVNLGFKKGTDQSMGGETDRTIIKRHKGIKKAVDKLSKEDYVSDFGNKLRQAIEEAKKVDAIKEIDKIVKTKTMGKLHGQKVDLFTASAIQQVYKAINHKNKEKMNSVMSKDVHGLLKMADFSMSKMKRR